MTLVLPNSAYADPEAAFTALVLKTVGCCVSYILTTLNTTPEDIR